VGTNQRRHDMLEKRARDALTDKAFRDARRIVAIWNGRRAKGRELWFHLRIGAAIAAGRPWLMFLCPACQQIGEIDLRTLDRHPNATIESLVLSLSCRRCRPNPPFVKLQGLAKLPTYRWTRPSLRKGARQTFRNFRKLAQDTAPAQAAIVSVGFFCSTRTFCIFCIGVWATQSARLT
jgi:hypothetical protein